MKTRLLLLLLLPLAAGAQTTGGQAPSVATGPPSGFTSSSVTVYGVVNPNGLSTYYYWEWGTSTAYGTILYPGSVGGQTTALSITSEISSLTPDTTYHYQLVATNSAGVSFGGDQSFTTPTVAEQAFSYTIANDTIVITGYGGPLGSVVIPDTIGRLPVASIGNWAFSGVTGLSSVTLPGALSTIGPGAFGSCTGLTSITIPPSVTQIQDSAFAACSGLTNVTVPEQVNTMGDHVFEGCTGLKTATINSSATGNYEFNGCTNLASIILGPNLSVVSAEAFENCSALTTLTIPDSLLSIQDGYNGWWAEGAFSFCTGLTNVIIGQSVTNLGDNAFVGCTNLATIAIGSNVRRIGLHALRGCGSLTGVTIPQSTTNIACDIMWAPYAGTPFSDCISLAAISVDPLNPAYSSLDGVLFDKSQTTLIACPGGKAGKYAVPDGVKNIQESAFYDCARLTSVTIPGSVTNLDWNVFYGCTNLVAIYFRGNAPTVGEYAFGGDNLTVYYLPGTTGWSTNFGGVPTAFWNPQAETRDDGFGVQHNRFGFNITGTTGLPLVVEASTDLTFRVWVPLQSCTLTNGLIHFSDSQWTNSPRRFYRIRSP